MITKNELINVIQFVESIIFDFDGVIANSEEFQFNIWEELFEKNKLPKDRLSIQNISGISDRIAIEKACPGLSTDIYDEITKEKKKICKVRYHEILPVQGVEAFLNSVNFKKNLFICSSSYAVDISVFMHKFFPMIEIKSIVGKGDYDKPKPDPAPYLKIMENVKSNMNKCVVIEDSLAGLQSAQKVGLPTIHFDKYSYNLNNVLSFKSFDHILNWQSETSINK